MQRRPFLIGTGAVVVPKGAGAWVGYDRCAFRVGAGAAFAPWNDWTSVKERLLGLVTAVIFAASSHKKQPWRFKASDNALDLHLNSRRYSRGLDPCLREEHIGMERAQEDLMLVAAANGNIASSHDQPCHFHFSGDTVVAVALAFGI
jgi:hypothetical protein